MLLSVSGFIYLSFVVEPPLSRILFCFSLEFLPQESLIFSTVLLIEFPFYNFTFFSESLSRFPSLSFVFLFFFFFFLCTSQVLQVVDLFFKVISTRDERCTFCSVAVSLLTL